MIISTTVDDVTQEYGPPAPAASPPPTAADLTPEAAQAYANFDAANAAPAAAPDAAPYYLAAPDQPYDPSTAPSSMAQLAQAPPDLGPAAPPPTDFQQSEMAYNPPPPDTLNVQQMQRDAIGMPTDITAPTEPPVQFAPPPPPIDAAAQADFQTAQAAPQTLDAEGAALVARGDVQGYALYKRATAPDATPQDMQAYQQHLATTKFSQGDYGPTDLYKGAYGAIGAGVSTTAQMGGQAGKFLLSNIQTNPIGAGMGGVGGGDVGGAPTEQQQQQMGKAGEFVGAQAPLIAAYAIAPQLGVPTALLDAYFAAEGVGTVKQTIQDYQDGKITGLQAVGELALTAPNFLPVVLHGTSKLSEIARSPEGKQFVAEMNTRLAGGESGQFAPGWLDQKIVDAQQTIAMFKEHLAARALTPEDRAAYKEAMAVEQQRAAVLNDIKDRGAPTVPGEHESQAPALIADEQARIEAELQRRSVPFGGRAGISAAQQRRMIRSGNADQFTNAFKDLSTADLNARRTALQGLKDELPQGLGAPDVLAPETAALPPTQYHGEVVEAGKVVPGVWTKDAASTTDVGRFVPDDPNAVVRATYRSSDVRNRTLLTASEPVPPGEPAQPGAEGANRPVTGDNPPPPEPAGAAAAPAQAELPPAAAPEASAAPQARPSAAVFDEYRKNYGAAAEQKMVEHGLIPASPDFAQVNPPVEPGAMARAGADEVGLGTPAEVPPGGTLEERLARPANQNSAMVSPEHQELIAALGEIVPSMRDRAAMLKQGRGRQFGARSQAIGDALASGKSNREALGAGTSAMSGQILPTKTLQDVFSNERIDGYYGDVLYAEQVGRITGGEALAAKNGLDLVTQGARSNGSSAAIMPHEIEAMKRVFGPGIEAVLPRTQQEMSLFQKVLAPIQVFRSFKTAFDDSFGGGQGWKFIATDNKAWWRGKVAGWRAALGDEATAERVMEKLRQDSPNFVRAQNADRPLGIMTTGAGMNPADEFLSPVTSRIPLLNRSERAFTVGGSVMRQQALDHMVDAYTNGSFLTKGTGKSVPDDVFQSMIDLVNTGSGWGSVKGLGDYQKALGQTLFSIRGKAGLVQYPINMLKTMKPGADPTLRAIAAKQFAGWLAMNAAVLAAGSGVARLMGMPNAGADVNPWSTNFGQVKFGPQKIDIWQGYSPIVRMIFQMAQGEKQPAGYDNPHSTSRWNLFPNYARGQLSPAASIAYDYTLGRGKSITGQDVNTLGYWGNQVDPLFIADTIDSVRQMGIYGVPGSVASFSGVRVNTYGDSPGAAKANYTGKLTAAGLPNADTAIAKDAGWRAYLTDGLKDTGITLDGIETKQQLRDAYIAKAAPQIAQRDGISLAEAQKVSSNYFDTIPAVKTFTAAESAAMVKFWKAHPDLLAEGYANGTVAHSKEKDTIVASYRSKQPAGVP